MRRLPKAVKSESKCATRRARSRCSRACRSASVLGEGERDVEVEAGERDVEVEAGERSGRGARLAGRDGGLALGRRFFI